MLAKVIIENGQKKIQALTADTGTGAPVGSYLYLEKKSNPQGYLFCDGSTFDETVYPALYQYLGTNVLPDWREFSAVGAEQNTTSSVIATHDVFTQGEEKDDQLQEHIHSFSFQVQTGAGGSQNPSAGSSTGYSIFSSSTVENNGRKGNVTRGKRKAVFIYIKATSGLTENQQENVLNTINENNSYSTEEHPTGKKWIDGKPIYRKVYYSATNWANYGLVDSNITYIDTIIKMDNIVITIDGTKVINFTNPIVSPVDGCGSYITSNNTLNAFRLGACQSTNPSWIILEYTKTTD